MKAKKSFLRNPLVLPALLAGLVLLSAGRMTAQTFTTLHSSDRAGPLILSGNTLYGTDAGDRNGDPGTVFALNTDGSGFANLHNFTGTSNNSFGDLTNSDGAGPTAGFISGNTLYGTAGYAGSSGNGTVFKLNTDGTGFTNLHTFTGPSFHYSPITNSDGAYPNAGLILSGDTLYGTAGLGGSSGNGTVFAVNTNGTGFTTLHSFTGGSDGAYPNAGLILSGNTLYGTAYYGGSAGNGTVFAINTDGTGFTNLHNFTALGQITGINGDGANPEAGLILSGNTLYGTASGGGRYRYGTVFAVYTDGTGFTTLHSFTGGSDGAGPTAGLIISGNTLYGTAGTVFSISFRPQLTIARWETNVILSWPTNVAGFDYTGYTLQSTTNLFSPAAWITNSPAPVVIAGQNTVTNPITGAQKFYRLIK